MTSLPQSRISKSLIRIYPKDYKLRLEIDHSLMTKNLKLRLPGS